VDTFVFSGAFNHSVSVNNTADIVLTSNAAGGDTTRLLNFETFQVGGVSYTLNQLLALSITQTENIIRDGTSRSETLNGDAGNDVLNSLGGNDTVNGFAGNDVLRGGTGTDTLYGGAGNDTLYGDDGTDYIYGGLDNDVIYGGIGNDRLYGDAGDDIIAGGAGLDMMYGGTGRDTYVLDVADGNIDRIYDFTTTGAGADTLDLSQLLIDYDSGTDLIADFVRFTVSGADTAIRVNADGVGNDFVTLGRIYGATLTNTVQDYLDQGLLVAG
jgi:Ca2+-binding RTX toxin-like protein